jgi:hypothetical protein
MRAARPHDSVNPSKSWSGLPSPGALRHPLPVGEGRSKKEVSVFSDIKSQTAPTI